jgi:hypothetical protein
MTDKATLQKLFDAAMRGNADFTGKPLKRAFPEPMLNTASKPQVRFERPEPRNGFRPGSVGR